MKNVNSYNFNISQQLLDVTNEFTNEVLKTVQEKLLNINKEVIKYLFESANNIHTNLSQNMEAIKEKNRKIAKNMKLSLKTQVR
jgi:hypothetical protein